MIVSTKAFRSRRAASALRASVTSSIIAISQVGPTREMRMRTDLLDAGSCVSNCAGSPPAVTLAARSRSSGLIRGLTFERSVPITRSAFWRVSLS